LVVQLVSLVAGFAVLAVSTHTVKAQPFNSGSNGSDGALNLTVPGTVVFDPQPQKLDLDGDNIYHFTTINIAAGVTVRLRANVVNGPLFWLAQGPINIAGTIDLSGDPGYGSISSIAGRTPSIAGAGGYGGGLGAWSASSPAQTGFGPGGGRILPGPGCPACCPTMSEGGRLTPNLFLVPLTGGSGGAGGSVGGGAGGGALLLASSVSVNVTGSIQANGGSASSGQAGGGAGGSVRIVAPLITGNGTVSANAGPGGGCSWPAADGGIRLEAFTFNTTLGGTRATPFNLFLPSSFPPSVRIISVASVPVPASPTGSFTMPDVTINSTAAVPFVIEARNIPVGTIVKVQVFSETGLDQAVDASPLSGTSQLSTATANITLPPGFSRGMVRATWTQ
jgi:hypothetical protein